MADEKRPASSGSSTTSADSSSSSASSDMLKVSPAVAAIQRELLTHPVRLREILGDFDKLRSGCCTVAQFRRGLDLGRVRVTEDQFEALVREFSVNDRVDYNRFVQQVEQVFLVQGLEKTPRQLVPSPGSTVKRASRSARNVENPALHGILHRIAMYAKTRGVVLKYCFNSFDQNNCGLVTEAQFRRAFPFDALVPEHDLQTIVDHYCEVRDAVDMVDYRALHEDIDQRQLWNPVKQNFATSTFVPSPSQNRWTSENYSVEQKLQAQVAERRIRLMEYFQDFDPLRKGHCTVGQLRTVCNIVRLKLSEEELEHILRTYSRVDGLICYDALVAVIDSAFTLPALEKTPRVRVPPMVPDLTYPARRAHLKLTEEEDLLIDAVEAVIRDRIETRRIEPLQMFQDFDRGHVAGTKKAVQENHCTRQQFSRVLSAQGFEVTTAEIEMLCKRYCDLGNLDRINYREFCAAVDVRHELRIARTQDISTPREPGKNKYFTRNGQIIPSPRWQTA